ncbi:MAG: hypothetical protein ACTSUN_07070, partial [Promethearchaeota archaeon]
KGILKNLLENSSPPTSTTLLASELKRKFNKIFKDRPFELLKRAIKSVIGNFNHKNFQNHFLGNYIHRNA